MGVRKFGPALFVLSCVLGMIGHSPPVSAEVPTGSPPLSPVPGRADEPAAQTEGKQSTEAQPTANPLASPEEVKRLVDQFLKEREEQARRAEASKRAPAARKPSVDWSMQIQTDGIWAAQDAANRVAVGEIPSGFAFRRARINLSGDYGPWDYKLGMDFALAGRPTFLDVYIGFNGPPSLGRVRVGFFFEPFGFEQYSQNRFLTFLERGLPARPFAPGRNPGVMLDNALADERVTVALGVFRTESDFFGNDTGFDLQSAVTGRLTGLVWYDEGTAGRDLLHLGLAYSARLPRLDQVRFRVRPEVRLGAAEPNIPFFVDTGNIPARFYQLLGGELFWVRGPFSLQGEYVAVPVSTIDRGAVYFQTWYLMASLFLTGEHRTYRKRTGQLERINPKRDFVRKDGGGLFLGPGAWEVACRVSHADLNNGGVTGGRLTDTTLGLNWYMNPYTRLTFNYIRANLLAPGGPGGAADFYGVRFNFDF